VVKKYKQLVAKEDLIYFSQKFTEISRELKNNSEEEIITSDGEETLDGNKNDFGAAKNRNLSSKADSDSNNNNKNKNKNVIVLSDEEEKEPKNPSHKHENKATPFTF
jgi:hypothetical protein